MNNEEKILQMLDSMGQAINQLTVDMGAFRQEVNQRFEKVEQRLDRVEQRLDGMEQRFDKVEQRLDSLENSLLQAMSDTAEAINATIENSAQNVQSLHERLNEVDIIATTALKDAAKARYYK